MPSTAERFVTTHRESWQRLNSLVKKTKNSSIHLFKNEEIEEVGFVASAEKTVRRLEFSIVSFRQERGTSEPKRGEVEKSCRYISTYTGFDFTEPDKSTFMVSQLLTPKLAKLEPKS